jgi:citrate synthase
MELNGMEPDFEPKGDLSLKCWFSNNAGLTLPKELDINSVRAVSPYDEQIAYINRHIGAHYPRQPLKDTSGASLMDPKTQVTKVHNISILEASKLSLEENLVMSLVKDYPDEYGRALANIALNAYVNHNGTAETIASDASRQAGNSPNTALSAAISILGKGRVKKAIDVANILLEKFQLSGLKKATEDFDCSKILKGLTADEKSALTAEKDDTLATLILKAVEGLEKDSVFIDFVKEGSGGKPSADALLSAIWMTLGWEAIMRKAISTNSITALPWYSRIFSTIVGCSVPTAKQTADSFCGVKNEELLKEWSFTETAFLALLGRRPTEEELFEFSMLLGLIISNGPGTISAQGCKGGVSADGPEDPARIQINKAFVGFLTHTGFAHGGNGYEAIAFLIDRFRDKGLESPSDKGHGLDLKAIADDYSNWYRGYKAEQKAVGNIDYMKIPCINHPVFKGKPVNYDPRERFVSSLFGEKGIYNIFLDFYGMLVQALFNARVSPNVYCVNVDAVIAVILLKMVWLPFVQGKISEEDIEGAAFTTFLFGRMIGSAAEIDDHINRGRNMDTRTPASRCSFVS